MVSMSDTEERQLWTADEFLAWLQPGKHADLIDEEILMHSPANLSHADLLNFLDHLLRAYIESNKLGKLYREVVAVRQSARRVFLPDLAFFTNEQIPRLKTTYAPITSTMVVEALSPYTADHDVGPKFTAYEQHGVQEYWILDPEHLAHRFYRREGELLFEFATHAEKTPAQRVPGFWVHRSWPELEHLPKAGRCLAEINAM